MFIPSYFLPKEPHEIIHSERTESLQIASVNKQSITERPRKESYV